MRWDAGTRMAGRGFCLRWLRAWLRGARLRHQPRADCGDVALHLRRVAHTGSQVCLPGTACCALTNAKARTRLEAGHAVFVEADDDAASSYNDGPADETWISGHPGDGLATR